MSEQQPVNINFRLIKITTEEFKTTETQVEEGEMNLSFDFQFGVNNEIHRVKSIARFVFKLEDTEIIDLAVSSEFEFEPQGWNHFVKQDKLVLPKDLLSQLAFFTMNTARGVLHSKTEGHKYNALVLPMISGEFVQQDLEIPLNEAPSSEGKTANFSDFNKK